MVTWSSTLPIAEFTSTEPMMNKPMMNSDRKMVMTAPKDVVQLRKKWRTASLME